VLMMDSRAQRLEGTGGWNQTYTPITDSFFGGVLLIFATSDLLIKGLRGELMKGKKRMKRLKMRELDVNGRGFCTIGKKGFWRTALEKPTALTQKPPGPSPRLSVSGSVRPQAKGT
jgi:hypothetical protein